MGLFDWQAKENARHMTGMRGYLPSTRPGGAVDVAFRHPVTAPAG